LPVLAMITFRPEYEAPWSGLSHVTGIALDRLAPASRRIRDFRQGHAVSGNDVSLWRASHPEDHRIAR
jgi:hypothetical protein